MRGDLVCKSEPRSARLWTGPKGVSNRVPEVTEVTRTASCNCLNRVFLRSCCGFEVSRGWYLMNKTPRNALPPVPHLSGTVHPTSTKTVGSGGVPGNPRGLGTTRVKSSLRERLPVPPNRKVGTRKLGETRPYKVTSLSSRTSLSSTTVFPLSPPLCQNYSKSHHTHVPTPIHDSIRDGTWVTHWNWFSVTRAPG